MGPDAAIVEAATCTAVVTAGLVIAGMVAAALRDRPGVGKAVLSVGVAAAVTGGGVAIAEPGNGRAPHPPAVSVDWPTGSNHPRSVLVVPGDSLWSIAAHRIERPTAVRIAAAWPHWWHTNRQVVGSDPNVIRPGQRLRPPVPVRSRS